jgi:hypothetical protein
VDQRERKQARRHRLAAHHQSEPHRGRRNTASDQPIRNPARQERRASNQQKNRRCQPRHVSNRKMFFLHEVRWQPRQQEIVEVIPAEVPNGRSPRAAQTNHLRDRSGRAKSRHRRTALLCTSACSADPPRGIAKYQGSIHASAPTPKTTNSMRHPQCTSTMPPTNAPAAGPSLVPASMNAFARPRCSCGIAAKMRE